MPLSLEDARGELFRFLVEEPSLSQIIAYIHARAIEDQTAAIREGTVANERVHDRVINTVSRAQGSA